MARKQAVKEKAPFDLMADFERSIKFNKRKFRFSPKQKRFLELVLSEDSKIIFVSGPAGSSKTYMSLYGMLKLMEEDFSKDILYVRSIAESADRGLGSLPGDITEKFDPFLGPLYDKMEEIVAPGDATFLKQKGKISAVPINFLRGASWQNLKELTTLITRIGEDSKIIIGGDFFQSDINGKSGFNPMFNKFDDDESEDMGIHTFSFNESDIVRSKILKFIIKKLES
jgi:phosphate starvation-inducible PhoH-like protein